MTIKRGYAYKILVNDKVVREGFAGVTALPDGTLPSESSVCEQIVQAVIGSGARFKAQDVTVELVWLRDKNDDCIKKLMEMALVACPEIVKKHRVSDTQYKAHPLQSDEDFLKSCGVSNLDVN